VLKSAVKCIKKSGSDSPKAGWPRQLEDFGLISRAHHERRERARERPERRDRRVSRVRPPELSLPVTKVSTALSGLRKDD
jgi:hypothetical protein